MSLSPGQLHAIELTERLGSILSLLSTAFVIGTFLYDKSFHKPINRLVFYASWGNIMANVGTLISRSGIESGLNQPLCQFQAFLIQMFLPADALWTLAMALNVYLTFFRKYNAQQLRALEWKYMIFCYGTPFIPAFTYFFIETSSRGKVYGSATLWCWVSPKWDFLRVATFYGPIWVVIVITMTIYTWAGKEIFAKRRQLKNFTHAATDSQFPVIQNPFISPFVSVKTTEIRITSELAPAHSTNASLNSFSLNPNGRIVSSQSFDPYTVSIGTSKGSEVTSPRSTSFRASSPANTMKIAGDRSLRQRRAAIEANKAAFSYCKCSILFFAALLVTWVPSSMNRVYGLVHPDKVQFPLLFISCFVLPLQGFWNAVIYAATSLPACQALWNRLVDHYVPTKSQALRVHSPYPPSLSPKRSTISSSHDSMKDFQYP